MDGTPRGGSRTHPRWAPPRHRHDERHSVYTQLNRERIRGKGVTAFIENPPDWPLFDDVMNNV